MCNRAWLVIALLAMVALPACAPWREPATAVSREKATIEALATRIKQETADIDTVPRPVVEQTLAGPEQPAPNLAPAMNVVESIEVIGQIGGATHAVAISGSLAYVGVGPCLLILNVSDPTDTSIIGQTGVLARHEGGGRDTLGTFRGVAVAGDLAYIADGYSGLRIIDVADPAAPRNLGSQSTTAGPTAFSPCIPEEQHVVSLSEHEQVNFPGAVAWVARGGWWQRAGAMGAVFEPLRPLMALTTLRAWRTTAGSGPA